MPFFPILGADSLAYLSVEGLIEAVRFNMKNKEDPNVGHCTACLTGEYPESLEWWQILKSEHLIMGDICISVL